ncbi:GPW/gp25 family protein [Hymenobacter pini]|uniref:GPW/gp25 family protein n=1 Tax=Hymenobacter pini TaxID=2880879 RepID=UPI001CF42CDF|nr:GPW/gp25 family protein [Hymenobacter pini]MCA8829715.1 GPW/gp25 family protein [Hymenobacter pini]
MDGFSWSSAGEEPANSFLGRGWSFPTAFEPSTLQLTLVAEEEDIRQSLYILFNTHPGERIMHPEYGCALRQFLFEQIDSSVITRIKATVDKAVLLFEPRVSLLGVEVHTGSINDGVLLLEVDYRVRTLNSRHNVVYPFKREATLLAGHR